MTLQIAQKDIASDMLATVTALLLFATLVVPNVTTGTQENSLCKNISSNTLLKLASGEHRISTTCNISGMSNIRVSGAGAGSTTVRCNGSAPGASFVFSSVRNVTLENMTIVGCGENRPIYTKSNFGNFTAGVVLLFEASTDVFLNMVTMTEFRGIGVVGRDTNVTLTEVAFSNCPNCSGAFFYGSGHALLRVFRCSFRNVTFDAQINIKNFVFLGAGLSVWNYSSVEVMDSHFSFLNAATGSAVSTLNSLISVRGSSFENNSGTVRGGVCGYKSTMNFANCSFTHNKVGNNGEGGAFFARASAVSIFDCTFDDNTAGLGGAIFIFQFLLSSDLIHIINRSVLSHNEALTGSAIYAGTYATTDGSTAGNFTIIDTLVRANGHSSAYGVTPRGAAVYVNEMSIVHIQGSKFEANAHGGAVQVSAGTLIVGGRVTFTENENGKSGGALSLYNNARLIFQSGCDVLFEENKASWFGGALYIQGDPNIERDVYTECAINFIRKGSNETFSIAFHNNSAEVGGHAIYATPITRCHILSSLEYKYLMNYTELFNIPKNQILSHPMEVKICGCPNSTNCRTVDGQYHVTTMPGASVRLHITSLDSNSHTSPSVVYARIMHLDDACVSAQLGSQQNVQWVEKHCDVIEYTFYGKEGTSFKLELKLFPGDDPDIIHVHLDRCGQGLNINCDNESKMCACACSRFLTNSGIYCNDGDATISRLGHKWVGFYPVLGPNGSETQALAFTSTCPLDYCSHTDRFSLIPDALCSSGRTGVLCGNCRANLSVVFGSSDCMPCSNVWFASILMYAALGLLLVATLFMLNLTVNQGTIYGVMFYTSVIQVNSFIFFNQTHLTPLQIIVSLINLDIGFPLCLYDGMDETVKEGFQFVFPAYLLAITIAFVLASRYCIKTDFSGRNYDRFFRFVRKRAVSVLVTLIYLAYCKLLRTVISVFTFITIETDAPAYPRHVVWFLNGNIEYLTGKHIALFVVALAISVVFLVPYTLALTFIPIIERFSDHNRLLRWLHQKANKLKPMNDAYYAPYRGLWRIWLGMRLWLLFILYASSSVAASMNPSLLLCSHAIVVSLFLFAQIHVRPFSCPLHTRASTSQRRWNVKSFVHLLNLLDSFYMANYVILAMTVSYIVACGNDDKFRDIAVGILTGLGVIVFFAILFYHATVAVLKLYRRRNADIRLNWTVSEADESIQVDRTIPAVSSMELSISEGKLREPLLDGPSQVVKKTAVN